MRKEASLHSVLRVGRCPKTQKRKMSRNNLDKVLKRIEKSEEKSLKILFKQRKDLLKALEDNERLIETKLTRGASPQENKLEQEIDKLTKVIAVLQGSTVPRSGPSITKTLPTFLRRHFPAPPPPIYTPL